MHVGILGGTGPAGSGLAMRLAVAGLDVTVGSRSKERADEICVGLRDQLGGDYALKGGDNSEAASAEVVVVATPWDAASATVSSLADSLDGKVVISMANALVRMGKEFSPLVPPRGSIAAHVAAAAPGARVAAAFHHLPAKALADVPNPIDSDVLVCSDHDDAFEAAAKLVGLIPGLRALNAGGLTSAAAIESMTAVLLQLNVRYKAKAAMRLTGIDLA